MKNFIKYNRATGNIVVTGQVQADGDLLLQGDADHGVLEGVVEVPSYVSDGVVVAYTPEQLSVLNDHPGAWYEWSNSTMRWVDTRPLDIARQHKWVAIKTERATRCEEPLTVGTRTFDATAYSQTQINGAVTLAMLAPDTWTLNWTLADNSVVTLTKAEVIELGLALGQRTNEVFEAARLLRVQVEAATTTEELNAISWS